MPKYKKRLSKVFVCPHSFLISYILFHWDYIFDPAKEQNKTENWKSKNFCLHEIFTHFCDNLVLALNWSTSTETGWYYFTSSWQGWCLWVLLLEVGWVGCKKREILEISEEGGPYPVSVVPLLSPPLRIA